MTKIKPTDWVRQSRLMHNGTWSVKGKRSLCSGSACWASPFYVGLISSLQHDRFQKHPYAAVLGGEPNVRHGSAWSVSHSSPDLVLLW